MNASGPDVLAILPELLLTGGALVLALSEVFLRGERRGYQPVVAGVVSALAFASFAANASEPARALFGGFAAQDGLAIFGGATVCVGLFLTVLVGAGFLRVRAAERGEFYALLLLSAAGMCLLLRATDLLLVFVAIELMSVPTYALATYLRTGQRPAEAAFKYFLLGAFSSALFLYGAALCYGATGQTSLRGIAAAGGGPLLVAGLAFLLAGLGFKVAAVPFHMWTPDVYEGSPTPVTTFMSVGVKTAAFVAMLRILVTAFGGTGLAGTVAWGPVVQALAVLTMAIGNLFALTQRSVKRMLAYSSVAHAGYLLVAVAAAANGAVRAEATQGLLFYLAAYTLTAAGAFGAVAMLERRSGASAQPWDLDQFAGLARRRPWAAAATAMLLLSLAGIPPSAGFVGKLLVLRAAVDAGLVPLAVVAVLTSVVGLYYYLRVVVYLYMQPPAEAQEIPVHSWATDAALLATAVAVLAVGIGPGLLSDAATAGAKLFGG